MRAERWFKVLVLGGAALGKGCGTPSKPADVEQEPPVAGAPSVDPNMGGNGGNAGSAAHRGGSAGNDAQAAGGGNSGSASDSGASSGSAGAVQAGGAGASSGSSGDAAGGSATAGSAGNGGSAGGLQCQVLPNGLGKARDPCGCPCCWATDCLNTDAECCVGFCKGADEGRGCCMP